MSLTMLNMCELKILFVHKEVCKEELDEHGAAITIKTLWEHSRVQTYLVLN